ncbi:hypothetical protein PtA15_14A93 [Puccinia triticina]|uniref:Uncharacterized protein n=1 Tax=Puccinia triticina TaxID=208348 RepID=A0ABY7D8J0_9BASI|nr:uncharacterized protein PtA15_14A93 [Puccinia triticina]WAQ91212.1 hypothetical protein PtA15_14A93 [Puccinia triticina]
MLFACYNDFNCNFWNTLKGKRYAQGPDMNKHIRIQAGGGTDSWYPNHSQADILGSQVNL